MKKGFTLIEVMGVIILLGILALVTIPYINGYTEKSKDKSYKTTVSKIIEASKNWNMKYGDSSSNQCLNLTTLKSSEFLSSKEIIDPETKDELTGKIIITKVNNTYKYEFVKGESC